MDNVKSNGQILLKFTPMLAFRLLLVIIWTQSTIFQYVTELFERIPLIGQFSAWVAPICIALLLFFSLPVLLEKIRAEDFLLYAIIAIIVIGSMLVFYDNKPFIEEHLARILVGTVPFFFLGICYSHEECKNDLFWASLIGVLTVFAYQIYFVSSGRELITDNMDAAYYTLPSVLYLVYWAIDKKKARYWLAAVMGITLTFVFGTRGAMLAIIIFGFLCLFLKVVKSKSIWPKIFFVVFSLMGAIILFSSDIMIEIAKWLSEVFGNFGFSTRIFDMFIENEIAIDNGRDKLLTAVLDAIPQNPLWGYGLMGDRLFTGGIYVHNLFVELWCQFGVVAGSLISLGMFFIPVKTLFKARKQDVFYFILMITCMIFTKLMFSGSYILEPYLFLLLGLSTNIARKTKSSNQIDL